MQPSDSGSKPPAACKEYPRTAYILLEPEREWFETTMFHETGHVAMDMLAGGRRLDGKEVASIPHSHRRALRPYHRVQRRLGHSSGDPGRALAKSAFLRWRYQHHSVGFGDAPYRQNEYYRGASDLTTFSQDMARYYDVRENYFAFDSAFHGPDYLRVQLERARDFLHPATLTNCSNRKAFTPASSSCLPCAARSFRRRKPLPSARIACCAPWRPCSPLSKPISPRRGCSHW